MTRRVEPYQLSPRLEGRGVRPTPRWFHRLTYVASAPVLLALLSIALLIVLPTTWRFEPPAVRRLLSFLFDVMGPLLAASFLAACYFTGGGIHWLLLGMGALALGAAGFVDATHLAGDPLDTGLTIHGICTLLSGVLSLLAVPFAYRPPKQQSTRHSFSALAGGYGGVFVLVTLLIWAKLQDAIPPFYSAETGSTMLRQVVLSAAVVALAAAASLLYVIALRRHPLALRWYALALALIAIGTWGQANLENFWGLLAWASRAVLALGVVYLVVGSLLAMREPESEPRVPLTALLQSEAQFRAFFENVGVGANQIGPDFRFQRVNDRYCAITGYSRSELLQMSPLELDHPDEREADRARTERLFADPDYTYDVEKRYLHKRGHTIWVHVTVSLVRDTAGEPLHTVGVVEDITERVLEERRAGRYTRMVAGINRVLSEVLHAETEEEVGNACLAVALEITGSPLGFIGEVRADERLHNIAITDTGVAFGGIGGDPSRVISPPDFAIDGLCRRVIAERASFFTNELPSHPESVGTLDDHSPLTSFLGVPLIQRDRVAGVLVVANREGGYTVEQQTDLEELAPALAQALWKKRAEEDTRQYLSELEVLDRTNRTLLREINHRVKNNLSAILGLLHAEGRRLANEESSGCELILKDLAERIRNLAAAHTLLSAGGWRPLQLSELAEEIIMAAAPLSMGAQQWMVEIEPSPVFVTPGQAHHLALVIGELVMNTIKYGHSVDCMGIKVTINLENDQVRMVYRDGGPGYSEAVISGEDRSVGLGLLDAIVTTSLRGSWSIRNDEGAVTEIRFPDLNETVGDNNDEL